MNAACKVLVPCFTSWNKISQTFVIGTKSLFLSNFGHKLVYIPFSEHFSFSKIIHPHDRCDISRSWLNGMIITQVHLVLGTIKGHSKLYNFVTQHNATDDSSFIGMAIGMLTAGMSTRAVAREFNVNFSDHVWPCQPRTSTSGFFTYGIVRNQPPGQLMNWGVFLSVIKPFCGEKLSLAPQWVGLCSPRPTYVKSID